MMELLTQVEQSYRKAEIWPVRSGDTVKVHQLIREGTKQRVQVFEGVVIRTHRMNELTAVMSVRRIASGVGVEKTFLLHSPNITKVEIVRRAKVRRNFLSYLRGRRGKSARLSEVGFDRAAANAANQAPKASQSDDELDAEVTEIDAEQAEDVQKEPDLERLETETKSEDEAAATGSSPLDDADSETDERAQPQQEAEEGVARVDDELDRKQ